MPPFSRLELENFKSYRSHTTIEWKQVSSILGQNGTGKSTIIDAVEYVFCFPRYAKKSVAFLRKELYNKDLADNEHSSTWVSATVNINNEEREFKRSVDYNESIHKYWVNNRVVELKDYANSLLQININPRANNFLVQQNSIESLALKNAKQRSEFFEVLSRSVIYKPDYNRLISEMKSMQSEVNTLQSVLELHIKEKKNLIQKSNDIKMYDELTQQLEQIEFDYYYIKLYEIKTIIDCLLRQKHEKQYFITKTEELVIEFKENIRKLKNEITEKENQIIDIETDLESHEPEILDYKRQGTELAERIEYCKSQIEIVNKNLKTARNLNSAHKKTMQDLEEQLREIEQQKSVLNRSLSQSCSLELDDDQYKEYLKLKAIAQKRFVQENQSFSTLERERNGIKDKINECKNKKEVLSNQVKGEKMLLNYIIAQKENVQQKIDETKKNMKKVEEEGFKLDEEINKMRQEVEDTINEIQDFNKKLSDYDTEHQANSSRLRLNEIIDTLTAQFRPRVLGRLSNLCKVTNKRYQIAITKILGHKIDGIVVDTTNTARECIEFLKERYSGDRHSAIATFFPLDKFQDKPVSEHVLRKVESVSYAKLAIDMMSTRQIDNLLKNFLGDIVICETDDQAMDLSYKLKIDCVSLDGTYFKKDGSFSGGYSDTRKKAESWNEGKYKEIEKKKQEKTEFLKSSQLQIRHKVNSQKDLQVKLSGLQRRLQEYLVPELQKCNEKLKTTEDNLQKLENDLESFELRSEINKLQESLEDIDRKLTNYKQREREIEDEVFSRFCEKYQLENIRKYEESDVRKHEERLKDRMKFDDHLSKINNQITYEKSRNTEETIRKLETKQSTLEKELKKLLENKKSWEKLRNKDQQRTNNKDKIKSIRCDIEKIKKDLAIEERKFKIAKNDLNALEKTVAVLTSKINQLQYSEIHQLLTKCKVKGIEIPLKKGTIEKMVVRSKTHDTESESSGRQTESDSAIQEKDVEIDFTQLDESIQNLEEREINNRIISLGGQRRELKVKLESCIPSNRDLKRESESLETKIKDIKKDLKAKQGEFKTIKENFEQVKYKRRELFIEFCSSVEKEIDGTFKGLYNDTAAQALITMVNPDDPYLDGINLSFLIPKKRFAMIEHLSGGEKTMCAMALFLAIFKAKPAPCIIFDEIDAALDTINLQNIVNLFMKWKQETQIISISHHECLFRCADAAIGINISTRRNSSYAIHLDLTRYLQPVDLSPIIPLTHRTPVGSPRDHSTSSSENRSNGMRLPSLSSSSRRSTGVRLPSVSSSSKRSTIGAPQHASTPTTIVVKSVEVLSQKTRIRIVNRSEQDGS